MSAELFERFRVAVRRYLKPNEQLELGPDETGQLIRAAVTRDGHVVAVAVSASTTAAIELALAQAIFARGEPGTPESAIDAAVNALLMRATPSLEEALAGFARVARMAAALEWASVGGDVERLATPSIPLQAVEQVLGQPDARHPMTTDQAALVRRTFVDAYDAEIARLRQQDDGAP